MGTEALWVPLALAAAGTGAQAVNTYQTAKREDQTAAQGIRQQAARQALADNRVSQEVGALQKSTPEDARQKATMQYMDQLRRTRGQAIDGGAVGATSDAYREDAAGAQKDVGSYSSRVADTLGRISAPGLQRQAEGQSFARLGSDLNTMASGANSDAFLQQLRQRSAGTRNAGLDAFGQLAQGAAGAYSGSAGGSTEPKPGTPAYRRMYGLRG